MNPGDLPPLKTLRAFEAAARHLSFTRAADELCVTQSAVSYQIRRLEQWLDFRLFRRVNNALYLTERGEHYARLISGIFQTLVEGTQHVADTESSRTLVINVRPHFGARWLVPRLARFAAAHPDVQLRLLTSNLGPAALEDEVDLAVMTDSTRPGLRFDFLFNADLFPVCSPGLAESRGIVAPRDLMRVPRLHVTASPDEWRLLLARAGIDDPAVDAGPRFETNELALVAAAHGWGVAIGRWPFVEEDVRCGRLALPLPLRLLSTKDWYLASRKDARSRKIEVFREWIVREAELTRLDMARQFAPMMVAAPGRRRSAHGPR